MADYIIEANPGGNSGTGESNPKIVGTLDRRDFLMGADTGVKIDRHTKEATVQERYGNVSAEQHRQTSLFLETYGKDLLRLQTYKDPTNPARTLFDAISTDPNHLVEQRAMKLLLDEIVDEESTERQFKVSEAKIAALLSTDNPQGWKMAMQLMDHQKVVYQQMLGMTVSSLPPGERKNLPQAIHARSGIGRGLLHKLRNRDSKEDKPGLWSRLNAEGEAIDLGFDEAMFESINSSDVETAYLNAMTGVNIKEFSFVPGGTSGEVVYNGSPLALSTNVQKLQDNILSLDNTRRNFMIDVLGVDKTLIDSGPEQEILRLSGVSTASPEQIGIDYEHAIQTRYQELGGFNPGNRTESIRRLMQARREILADQIQKTIADRREKPSREKSKSILRERLQARDGDSGRVVAERRKKFAEQEERLEKDRSFVDDRGKLLSDYELELSKLTDARNAAYREAGVSTVTDIEREVEEIKKGLDDITIAGSYAKAEYTFLQDRKDELQRELRAITVTGKGKAKVEEETTAAVLKKYAAEERRLLEWKQREEAKRDRLSTLRNEIKTQEGQLLATKEVVADATKELTTWEENYSKISSWDSIGGALLDDANLRGKTTDEILAEVNKAHTADPTKGWPESENAKSENRQMIERARLEVDARAIEASDPSLTARIRNFDTLKTRGISEHQMRTLSSDQMLEDAHNLFITSGGALGWEVADDAIYTPHFENAQKAAQTKFAVRIRAVRERLQEIEKQIGIQRELSTNVDLTSEREKIEITLDLMDRQGEIFKHAEDLITQVDEFTDTTKLTNTEPDFAHFSKAEQDASYSKGYYKMVDFLFDYQENASDGKIDRSEYFKKIQKVLPPDELGKLLDQAFGLGVGGTPDFDTVVRIFRREIRGGRPVLGFPGSPPTIFEYNIRKPLSSIIDEMRARAQALD